jgi:hypothetical protein
MRFLEKPKVEAICPKTPNWGINDQISRFFPQKPRKTLVGNAVAPRGNGTLDPKRVLNVSFVRLKKSKEKRK